MGARAPLKVRQRIEDLGDRTKKPPEAHGFGG